MLKLLLTGRVCRYEARETWDIDSTNTNPTIERPPLPCFPGRLLPDGTYLLDTPRKLG